MAEPVRRRASDVDEDKVLLKATVSDTTFRLLDPFRVAAMMLAKKLEEQQTEDIFEFKSFLVLYSTCIR